MNNQRPNWLCWGDSNLYGYVLNDLANLVDPRGKNPLLLGILVFIGLSEWLNAPSAAELLRDDFLSTLLIVILYMII